jgi:tRNA pseudouridine55 synthase
MPRASTASLPISGLFAVEKPSGPTSMAVVETIKHLVARSRLFVEAEKLQEAETKGKGKRRHKHREAVKIGQGGTLDPLADGVLGEPLCRRIPLALLMG